MLQSVSVMGRQVGTWAFSVFRGDDCQASPVLRRWLKSSTKKLIRTVHASEVLPNHTTGGRMSQIATQATVPHRVAIPEHRSSRRPQPCTCAIKWSGLRREEHPAGVVPIGVVRAKKAAGAWLPAGVPEFFIRFLTEPRQLVLDPFAGSNVTG